VSGDWSAEEAIQTDNLLIREALARLKAGQLLSNDHIQQLDYLVQRRQSAIQSNESVVAALKVQQQNLPVLAQQTLNKLQTNLLLVHKEIADVQKLISWARWQLWFAAVKPPMYTVCIIPVLVAATLAYYQTGVFATARFWQLIFASICTIAWLNLSNDAFDAQKGVDGAKDESVVNITGNRAAVLWTANAFLAAALCTFARALHVMGDMRPFQMLGVALAMGYMYQGPPFRLSYKGLGEPICVVAFGPLSVGAFYIAQAGAVAAGTALPAGVWAASLLVGTTVASVLFCSHWHQIEGDRAAGKMSPLVRLGPDRALQVLRVVVGLPYAALLASVATGWLPRACVIASLLSGPGALELLRYAREHASDPVRIRPLKKYAIKWHTPFGLALAAGLAYARRAAPLL